MRSVKEDNMWSTCHPRTENDYTECAYMGKSLNRLTQPAILSILMDSDERLHGYIIVQKLAETPMYGGRKPDATGVYRTLKQMEKDELVSSEWNTPNSGPAKKDFVITDKGRSTLRRWVDTLACYQRSIEELRGIACESLNIEVPEDPCCSAH